MCAERRTHTHITPIHTPCPRRHTRVQSDISRSYHPTLSQQTQSKTVSKHTGSRNSENMLVLLEKGKIFLPVPAITRRGHIHARLKKRVCVTQKQQHNTMGGDHNGRQRAPDESLSFCFNYSTAYFLHHTRIPFKWKGTGATNTAWRWNHIPLLFPLSVFLSFFSKCVLQKKEEFG